MLEYRPMKDDILVEQLSKTFQVPEREPGFGAALRSFFHRKYRDVQDESLLVLFFHQQK